MKKAKRYEVPPEYRRNRKKEFVDFLLMLATCVGAIAAFTFLLLH